jgi:stress response protein YsnF
MPGDAREVVALFQDADAARRAGRELVFAGFRDDEVQLEEQRGGLLDTLLGEPKEGGILVRVRGSGRFLEAAAILHRAGGRDPDERKSTGEGAVTRTAEAAEGSEGEAADGGRGAQLELIAEELVPRVEPVQVGEVRVLKRVVTEKRTIEVEVRHEEVDVEHHPTHASGSPPVVMEADEQQPSATEAETAAPAERLPDDEDLTRIPVFAEQIVVSRRPYVVEEIWVRKRRVLERRTVAGEVRREELEVEPVGEVSVEETGTGAIVRAAAPRRRPKPK